MKQLIQISNVFARQIIDSRGTPTIEAEVMLETGFVGRASVPSGASTGAFEAVELRDGKKNYYLGKSVQKAVDNVNEIIAPKLKGKNILNQLEIDQIMIDLDNTPNKSKLGANAILSVSLACAHAASQALGLSLYNYIGGAGARIMPIPMMNILNGGKHSDNNLTIQEFMIMPIGASNFHEALQWCVEVFHTLKNLLHTNGYSVSIGDEGGFAPNLANDEEAIKLIVQAIQNAGFTPGEDFKIALDVASTEMYEMAKAKNLFGYYFWKSDTLYTPAQMIQYLENLCAKYPIASIEDGLAEEDWENWKILTSKLGDKIQLVGDDLFVTNTQRLEKGIKSNVANSILVKLNQIGTLSETIKAVELAHKSGYTAIISHRSGETEDTTIADLAVALNCGQIKTGAPSRTDRVAKYNQLLRIEEQLLDVCEFGDKRIK